MSRLGLAHLCAYGFRDDVASYPRVSGKPARIGSLTHSLVEASVNGTSVRDDVDPVELAEAKAIFDGPLSGFVSSRKWTVCEQGYRYDAEADACAVGPRRGEPGYEDVGSMVLPGTVDLVAIEGDVAHVFDVKTGKPPTDAEQLYGQAVSVSRRFGVRRVRVGYARALKTKLEILNEEELDADRLDAEAGRIRRLLRVLPTSEPNAGDWCWKCEARPACPAQRRDEYVPPEMPAGLYEEARLF